MTNTMRATRDTVVLKMKTGEYALVETACLCGEKKYILLANKDRYDIPIQTVLCHACGLVRSNPYYTDKTLADFYSKEYRLLYNGTQEATSEFFFEQRAFGRHIMTFLSEKVFGGEIKGKKIFEIGCGAGGILEAFRENGNDVFGCDYGEAYIAFGKNKGLHLVAGGASTLRQFGTADIVILNHVLEHIPRPAEELTQIKELLSPTGTLYIALPGIYYIHDTYRGNLTEYIQNAHAWYFTLKTLNSTLAVSGFQLVVGNEIIMAAFRKSDTPILPEKENWKNVLRYLKKTKRLRWYYGLKKFSPRHTAFETLRRIGPLYGVIRKLYRAYFTNNPKHEK